MRNITFTEFRKMHQIADKSKQLKNYGSKIYSLNSGSLSFLILYNTKMTRPYVRF